MAWVLVASVGLSESQIPHLKIKSVDYDHSNLFMSTFPRFCANIYIFLNMPITRERAACQRRCPLSSRFVRPLATGWAERVSNWLIPCAKVVQFSFEGYALWCEEETSK